MWKFTGGSSDDETVPSMMQWHKLTLRPQIHLPTYATSVLPLSALVKGLLVLLGCSLFVAELLLDEPDRQWLAGARDVCLCVQGSDGPCCTLQAARFPACEYLYVWGGDFKEETKFL